MCESSACACSNLAAQPGVAAGAEVGKGYANEAGERSLGARNAREQAPDAVIDGSGRQENVARDVGVDGQVCQPCSVLTSHFITTQVDCLRTNLYHARPHAAGHELSSVRAIKA